MKRYLALFAFQLLVCVLNAQTFTFNMHEMDNTKYKIVIDIKEKKITATKAGSEVFSERFYNYTIDRQQTRIGLSVGYYEDAVTEPYGSSFFIISRGKGIAIRLEDGTEYKLKCDNATSNASTYDQLAKILFPPPSPPPSPPSNNDYRTFTVNCVSFHMVQVQGGTFTMGATSEQLAGLVDYEMLYFDDAKPTHRVTLSSYMIGQTEVTQALWFAVMGSNSSEFIGDSRRPVEFVSWDACQEFIRKLNSLTGQRFRLPTEAEWEFAARGGNKSRGYKYSGSNIIDNVAWYEDNAYCDGNENDPNYGTHPVATKKPNELGLYDMTGNVCEWCNDWYDEKYYSNSSSNNPRGPLEGSDRVLRGGSWSDVTRDCRVSLRYDYDCGLYGCGLRLAL